MTVPRARNRKWYFMGCRCSGLFDDFDDDFPGLDEDAIGGDMLGNGDFVIAALEVSGSAWALGVTLEPVEVLDGIAAAFVIAVEILLADFPLSHAVSDHADGAASDNASDEPGIVFEEAIVVIVAPAAGTAAAAG
jgi:hypothetical protein